MAQIRTFENRGIIKLTQNERSGKVLRLYTEVLQLPFSEYVNTKTNPPHGFYGYVTLWAKEFVLRKISIEFHQQLLIYEERYAAQLGEQIVCNSTELLKALVVISNQIPSEPKVVRLQPDLIEYPIWAVTDIKFVLVPGCVIKASFGEELNQKCAESGIVQPDLLPPDSIPTPPPSPPPPDTPDSEKIPLSPPYQGEDDNGDTFVRSPEPEEPEVPETTCDVPYLISWSVQFSEADGSGGTASGQTVLNGEILGTETFYNPAFDSYAFRVKRRSCAGVEEVNNLYAATGITSLSGSLTSVTPA